MATYLTLPLLVTFFNYQPISASLFYSFFLSLSPSLKYFLTYSLLFFSFFPFFSPSFIPQIRDLEYTTTNSFLQEYQIQSPYMLLLKVYLYLSADCYYSPPENTIHFLHSGSHCDSDFDSEFEFESHTDFY